MNEVAQNLFIVCSVDAAASIAFGLSLLIVPMTPPRCPIVSYLQEIFFYASALVLATALVVSVA
jgi:hypothetical protein